MTNVKSGRRTALLRRVEVDLVGQSEVRGGEAAGVARLVLGLAHADAEEVADAGGVRAHLLDAAGESEVVGDDREAGGARVVAHELDDRLVGLAAFGEANGHALRLGLHELAGRREAVEEDDRAAGPRADGLEEEQALGAVIGGGDPQRVQRVVPVDEVSHLRKVRGRERRPSPRRTRISTSSPGGTRDCHADALTSRAPRGAAESSTAVPSISTSEFPTPVPGRCRSLVHRLGWTPAVTRAKLTAAKRRATRAAPRERVVHPAFPRIIVHPRLLGGAPCIRDIRISVANVTRWFPERQTADCEDFDDALAAFIDDIMAYYAAAEITDAQMAAIMGCFHGTISTLRKCGSDDLASTYQGKYCDKTTSGCYTDEAYDCTNGLTWIPPDSLHGGYYKPWCFTTTHQP